jgi:Cytochrome c7 and related cytochrome c
MPGDGGRSRWRRGLGALALAALAAGARVAWAQVSPGPLAGPHASLDGATQCFQCHVRGGKPADMDGRCLACHTEVARMKQANRGYHARVDKNCASCHPDHAGRTFSLIAWDEGSPEKFDHARTGWTLDGAHAKLACRDCHQPKFQRGSLGATKKKDKAASWLGLDPACGSCHVDVHRGHLGLQCLTCHRVDAWRPAPGFDHAKTSFPLTGRHVNVACDKCHATPALLAAAGDTTNLAAAHAPAGAHSVYAPVPHDDCASCHRDPHAGRFGAACARCHTNTESFHTIRAAGFDHDKTRYPLRGRHATVACARCHDPKLGGWGEKPAFASCTSCHRDAHAGTATRAGKVVDCASCHDVSGFAHSTYTVTDHARTAYALDGAHARAACEGCHTKATGSAAVASVGSARVLLRLTARASTVMRILTAGALRRRRRRGEGALRLGRRRGPA